MATIDWSPQAQPGVDNLILAAEAHLEFIDSREEGAPAAAVLIEAAVPADDGGDAPTTELANRAMADMVEDAVAALADSLVARERLRRAPHAELLSALLAGLKEPSMRTWALQLATERGLKEAVPAAIAALEAEDEVLRSVAVAVLVELGDMSTVPALIAGADFDDYEELRVLIEAVSAIGGWRSNEILGVCGQWALQFRRADESRREPGTPERASSRCYCQAFASVVLPAVGSEPTIP
ncbi:MAG: HEAT repeat domain-containing protein [Myxococcales bacterium]|nr:HEAT repeat domain-containing protein [Myxococcales bacterium]